MVGCQALSTGYEFHGAKFDPPLEVPDFELMSASGQPFRFSQTQGQFNLIYFGYTFCPDVCPLTLVDLKEALQGLPEEAQVNVIFISVDPERDTPEVVERYVSSFGPEFIGLTDDYSKIEEVMLAYGAYAEKEKTPDSAAGYLVSHTARVYLMTPEDGILLTYPFGFEPEDLRSDLEYLLQTTET
jgi:protein SCO1/2